MRITRQRSGLGSSAPQDNSSPPPHFLRVRSQKTISRTETQSCWKIFAYFLINDNAIGPSLLRTYIYVQTETFIHEYCTITSEKMLHSACKTGSLTTNRLLNMCVHGTLTCTKTELGCRRCKVQFPEKNIHWLMYSKERPPFQTLGIY